MYNLFSIFHFNIEYFVFSRKPQQKEIDDWQTKYPFSREIDPFSEYRLPYLLEMFTKDFYEIIRPEINLLTYDRWFEISNILKLDRDDICTYAIKGTVSFTTYLRSFCLFMRKIIVTTFIRIGSFFLVMDSKSFVIITIIRENSKLFVIIFFLNI